MNTWELTLAKASEQKTPAIVVVPESRRDKRNAMDNIMRRFRLDPTLAGFMFVNAKKGSGGKAAWPGRDAAIIRQADILLPISIRPGGNMERMLKDNPGRIHDAFAIPCRTTPRPRPRYDSFRINPVIRDDEWLIHFTRSTPGPWPDETDFDYYKAVCGSGRDYCRSAAATLNHILSTGIIYGSTRNIRHGGPVVGFTCFIRDHCKELFRYRPRLVNPYFEPYGIAIRREAASDTDIRPVRYETPDRYADLAAAEKPYFQNVGSDGEKWKGENEWRHAGDFRLSLIPANAGKVIVPYPTDVGRSAFQAAFAVCPLFIENTVF